LLNRLNISLKKEGKLAVETVIAMAHYC